MSGRKLERTPELDRAAAQRRALRGWKPRRSAEGLEYFSRGQFVIQYRAGMWQVFRGDAPLTGGHAWRTLTEAAEAANAAELEFRLRLASAFEREAELPMEEP